MKEKRKIQAVRRIRDMLDQQVRPTVREAGLTEAEFQVMAAEDMFDIGHGAEAKGLERYVIVRLKAPAISLLALADVPTHHVASGPLDQKTKSARFFWWLGSKLWEIFRLACSAIIGGIVGWYLKKHFP